MKTLIQFKTTIPPVLVCMLFVCIGLSPKAQAVVPPPDGGYPNFTTAEGQNALFSLTAGVANTAIGWSSLRSNTTGGYNTATGAATLLSNTGDLNTATGAAALFSNTIGFDNTASGALALFNNIIGVGNTATGYRALYSNTGGNPGGNANTATGSNALQSNISGSLNVALGVLAGNLLTTGDNNIYIGSPGVNAESNTIRLGGDVGLGFGTQTAAYIAGISGQTASGGAAVFVTSDGKLGTSTSSVRFKDEVQPMGKASEAILALKPVRFRYKKEIDSQRIPQFGLVAEDVDRINPDLVVRDKEGKPYSVRYDQVNAMLLNEFLKEHKAVQELKKEIAALRATVRDQVSKMQRVSEQLELSKAGPRLVDNGQ